MFGGLFRDKVKLILYEQIVQKLEHNLNSLTYESTGFLRILLPRDISFHLKKQITKYPMSDQLVPAVRRHSGGRGFDPRKGRISASG